jgi:hypothetical protein
MAQAQWKALEEFYTAGKARTSLHPPPSTLPRSALPPPPLLLLFLLHLHLP